MRTALTATAVLLLATAAFAQEADEDLASENAETASIEEENIRLRDRIRAVSNSTFLKGGRFELAPFAGISMSDAFFRRWTVGGRASFFIAEGLALDAGGAFNVFSQPLAPVVLLGEGAGEFIDNTPVIGYGDIGVAYSPFYGKLAAMSEWIVHFDAFATGGIGATFDGAATPVDPALQLGGGARVVLNRALALRAEVRDYITLAPEGLNNFVVVNVGISVFFPFDFENIDRGTKDREG